MGLAVVKTLMKDQAGAVAKTRCGGAVLRAAAGPGGRLDGRQIEPDCGQQIRGQQSAGNP